MATDATLLLPPALRVEALLVGDDVAIPVNPERHRPVATRWRACLDLVRKWGGGRLVASGA